LTWTKQSAVTSPGARFGASMAYDAATGNMVLFGGSNNGVLGGTWVWNGSTWTKQAPATSPPARSGAPMAYDTATRTVVMFGGSGSVRGRLFRDTWVWKGSTWTKQAPATSPPIRWGAAMAYDAATRTVVLFGGADTTGTGRLADTWVWNGSTWTKQTPATSPPARFGAAMAYDAATGEVVLFSGEKRTGLLGDTWAWNGSTWTKQTPATSPPARFGAAMAYDAATRDVVLFGGLGGPRPGALGGTWVWNGSTWTKQTPATSPPARWQAPMAYDATTGNVVLFGGARTGGQFGDTWTWGSS
jgi:hypothetical protein